MQIKQTHYKLQPNYTYWILNAFNIQYLNFLSNGYYSYNIFLLPFFVRFFFTFFILFVFLISISIIKCFVRSCLTKTVSIMFTYQLVEFKIFLFLETTMSFFFNSKLYNGIEIHINTFFQLLFKYTPTCLTILYCHSQTCHIVD